MGKPSTVEDLKLNTSYEAIRKTLLQDHYADRLSKPLGYWVLPNDRRLPLAFLGRSLQELLSTPFQELSATPGIGQKKISSLVKLLHRATRDEPPAVPFGISELASEMRSSEKPSSVEPTDDFDPSLVSEALWTQWRDEVRKRQVGDEKLGRLAPTLQTLPTVIWHTPMSQYLDYSVAEIRRLRTHGEKRVRCVLEVFHSVYQRLVELGPNEDLERQLSPAPIRRVQDWVEQRLQIDAIPVDEEVMREFVEPLLAQLRTDSGATVYRLVEERLGLGGEAISVRAQARSMGVTRARVYQLLDDCGKVMSVRWPDGLSQLEKLNAHFAALGHPNSVLRLYYGVKELCFPEKVKEQGSTPTASRKPTAVRPGMPSDMGPATTSPSPGGVGMTDQRVVPRAWS